MSEISTLNFHHLRAFWATAQGGGLAAAARTLGVSASTVWAQLRALEDALGARLLERRGRRLVLTELGRETARVASDIFARGQDVLDLAAGRAQAGAPVRLGVLATVPRLVAERVLEPALALGHPVQVRQGAGIELLGELAQERLDLVLSDQPLPEGSPVRASAHPLGSSRLALFAAPDLAQRLRDGFPRSLEGAPALLPSEGTVQRAAVEGALGRLPVQPRVVAEADDSGLLKALAARGFGFLAAPQLVEPDLLRVYGLERVGVLQAREAWYALTLQRRLPHPGVAAILAARLRHAEAPPAES